MEPIYIPDIVEELVATAAGYLGQAIIFDKGHYTEIVRNQTTKGANPVKPARYPLVWLVLDMDEDIYTELTSYSKVKLHLIIAMDTTATRTVDERRDLVFKPVLYPIYAALLKAIRNSPKLNNSFAKTMKHKKTDRYYWGGQDAYGNGKANLFNDMVDAIQLRDLYIDIKPAKADCVLPSLKQF